MTGDAASVADGNVDTSTPDFGVDSRAPDFGVDSRAPDFGVDSRAPDFGVDSRAPDFSVDSRAPDLSLDTLKPDTTSDVLCVPACGGMACGADDGCGGTCIADCTNLVHRWSTGAGSFVGDYGKSVAVDMDGDVTAVGMFFVSADFGDGPLASTGGTDIFVARYRPSGALVRSQRIGASSSDLGNSVAVDSRGNITIVGHYSGTVDFGDGPRPTMGGTDIFVASYDAAGGHRWSKRFGGGTSNDLGYGVAVDSDDNVTITGSFGGAVDFGGGALPNAGSADIVVASYDSNGTHRWSMGFGSSSDELGFGAAADGDGNVTITGSCRGPVDFGGGLLGGAGNTDIFVASFGSKKGAYRWAKRFGDSSVDAGNDVAAAGNGNVTLTGDFSGSVDFGGGERTSAGGTDIFVASYDSNGEHRWSEHFGAGGGDRGRSAAVDDRGNVTLTGDFSGSVDFGGGALTSAGTSDIFASSYGPDGGHRWAKRFGASGGDSGNDVAVDGQGNVTLVGSFSRTVDFGGGALTSEGGIDIFILQLEPQL